MHDPFEESLRDLLKSSASVRDDDEVLERVLKTASRQIGIGGLFTLMGRWFEALMIGVKHGATHITPVSRDPSPLHSPEDKAD